MKNLYTLIILLGFTAVLLPQSINGRFSSSLYTFERYDSVSASNNYVRAYQMLNLNMNQRNVSLRTYMDYEGDISSIKMVNDPVVRFYNLYLEVRDLFGIATLKLGRQPIFNSVVGGVYDGANVDLSKSFYKFTAYYGGDVPAYEGLQIYHQWDKDYIFGGKFTTVALHNFQMSLGYVNKNFKPQDYYATRLDANLNPIQVLISNNSLQYQFASAEVNYSLQEKISVFSRIDYDFNFNRTSKVEVDGNYSPSDKIRLSAYYDYRAPMISYNSIFSVFDYGNTQEFEVGADYIINNLFTVTGRYGNVVYQGDNSQRVTIGLNTNYGTFSYRKTFGYAGELDALSLSTGYTFFDGFFTPSIGVSYTKYKLSNDPLAPTNDLAAALAGFNIKLWRQLSFDLQGQYMDNKIYRNDFRMFLKLNYWFNANL